MIQQMLRLRSQELPNAEADGSLPCYLRWMTRWILTLGFPEPRASCAQVRFRCTGARDVLAPCRPRAGAGRERSQPCVAPGPGSCRPTRPLGSAMRSLFAAAAARGGPCQVSSRCSRVTTCTAPCSAASRLFFLFPAGFRGCCAPEGCWFAGCWTEHSGPSFSSCSFPHSQLPKTVSLHSPWAVLCLGCHCVLFGVSQCCPNAFPLPVLAAGSCPPLGASRSCEGAGTAAPTGHGRAESAEIRGCSRQRGLSPPLGLAGAVGTARLEAGLCPCCHFQPAQRLLPARRWYFAARPRDTVSLLSAHAYPPPQPSRHSRETFI